MGPGLGMGKEKVVLVDRDVGGMGGKAVVGWLWVGVGRG